MGTWMPCGTSEVPYRNITRKQAIPQAILRGDPPMMNVTGTVAQSLWNCIEKCWSMVPNDRPHTSEVGEQLLHLLSQQKQQEQKQQQQQQQQQENLQMPLEPSVDIWQGPLVFNYPTLQLDTFNIKTSRKQHIWVCAKSLQSTDGAGLFVHWPLRLAFTSFEFQNINLDSILKLVEEKSIPLCLFNPINSKIEGTTEATTVNEDEYKRLVALLAEEEAGICLYSSAPDCVHNSGVLLFTRNTGENDIQLIGAVFSTISIPPLNGHLFYWKIPNEPPLLRHEVINRCSQRRYSHGQQQRQLEQQQAAPTPHAQVQAHNSGGEFGSALGMGSGANTDSSLLSNNQHPAHFQGASTNSASTGSPAEAAVDWFTDCLKEYRFP
ncbi:hypothetical protein FRC03_005852 [Tulasnella sp. 419]|nr:hypothetical protein FRC03_005852 [Tulasnella sp. 419]